MRLACMRLLHATGMYAIDICDWPMLPICLTILACWRKSSKLNVAFNIFSAMRRASCTLCMYASDLCMYIDMPAFVCACVLYYVEHVRVWFNVAFIFFSVIRRASRLLCMYASHLCMYTDMRVYCMCVGTCKHTCTCIKTTHAHVRKLDVAGTNSMWTTTYIQESFTCRKTHA